MPTCNRVARGPPVRAARRIPMLGLFLRTFSARRSIGRSVARILRARGGCLFGHAHMGRKLEMQMDGFTVLGQETENGRTSGLWLHCRREKEKQKRGLGSARARGGPPPLQSSPYHGGMASLHSIMAFPGAAMPSALSKPNLLHRRRFARQCSLIPSRFSRKKGRRNMLLYHLRGTKMTHDWSDQYQDSGVTYTIQML